MRQHSRKPNFHRLARTEVKQPPLPGLLIIQANGANFREAKSSLSKHCLNVYGVAANLITTGERLVRQQPTARLIAAEYADFGAEHRSKILISLISEHRALLRSDQETFAKMFGLFLQLLEDDGLERVKAHSHWPEAEAGMLAYEGWQIIESTHTTHISNVSPGEAIYNSFHRFNSCRQQPGMSISIFRENLIAAVNVMKGLRHPQTPNEASIARHFVHNLNKI